jgi:hypothetical protein
MDTELNAENRKPDFGHWTRSLLGPRAPSPAMVEYQIAEDDKFKSCRVNLLLEAREGARGPRKTRTLDIRHWTLDKG